jgi:O-antigen ligase
MRDAVVAGGRLGPPRAPLSARNTRRTASSDWISRRLLYLFAFSIPFETVQTGFTSGSLSISKLAGFLLVMYSVFQPRAFFGKIPRPLFAFAGYVAVLGGWTVSQMAFLGGGSISNLFTLVQNLVLFWLAYNLIREPSVRRGMISSFAAACMLLSALQLTGVTARASAYNSFDRVAALGENLNTVGALLALGMISAMGLTQIGTSRWRVLWWVGFVAMAAPLIQTGSRSGALGLAAGVMALLFRGGGIAAKFKIVLVVFAMLVTVVTMTLQSDIARSRWEQTLYTQNKFAGREEIYAEAIPMVGERPYFGWGPYSNVVELGRRLGSDARDTHNDYLFFLTESGFLGAAPMFLGIFLCLRQAWRARGGIDGALPLALLTTVLTVNLAGSFHDKKWLWLIMALACASGLRAARSRAAVSPPARVRTRPPLRTARV